MPEGKIIFPELGEGEIRQGRIRAEEQGSLGETGPVKNHRPLGVAPDLLLHQKTGDGILQGQKERLLLLKRLAGLDETRQGPV